MTPIIRHRRGDAAMLDVGVVGGGLMGMATSYFLLRSGRCRVTLYDTALRRPTTGYNACASAVAGGLLHPLTPKLKPAWEATEALRKADALVREAEREAHMDLITTDVVLRPAIDDDDAADLRAAAEDRPEWLEWLEPDAFVITSGRADLDRGGLRYIGGRCVDPRGYLDALRKLNEATGDFSIVEEAVDPRELDHAEAILCGGADAFRRFPELFPGGLTLTCGAAPPHAIDATLATWAHWLICAQARREPRLRGVFYEWTGAPAGLVSLPGRRRFDIGSDARARRRRGIRRAAVGAGSAPRRWIEGGRGVVGGAGFNAERSDGRRAVERSADPSRKATLRLSERTGALGRWWIRRAGVFEARAARGSCGGGGAGRGGGAGGVSAAVVVRCCNHARVLPFEGPPERFLVAPAFT